MKNLFLSNSDKTHDIMMKIKLLFSTIAVSSYASSHEQVGFWLLASTGIADILVSIFSVKPENGSN